MVVNINAGLKKPHSSQALQEPQPTRANGQEIGRRE
jgi:hypothetical protein